MIAAFCSRVLPWARKGGRADEPFLDERKERQSRLLLGDDAENPFDRFVLLKK